MDVDTSGLKRQDLTSRSKRDFALSSTQKSCSTKSFEKERKIQENFQGVSFFESFPVLSSLFVVQPILLRWWECKVSSLDLWCDPTFKEGRYWEIPFSGFGVLCVSRNCALEYWLFVVRFSLFGFRRESFYDQNCRNHSTWFWCKRNWCKRNILLEARKYILQENILCCWIVLSSL